MKPKTRIWVCPKDQVKEGDYIRVEALFGKEPSSFVVFRFEGTCLCYRNLCVHMPRRLDCEKDMIFDDTGRKLRCSMHGIIYDPVTGESLSTICEGEKLTRIKVQESEEGIWIIDKRVKSLPE
ncbi:MAG: Rieske 2Fe-2S domain-containing protein [Candidatus Thiodiazotropha sp.]